MPTIDGLPAASAVANADELPLWQSGSTWKASRQLLLTAASAEPIELQSGAAFVGCDAAGGVGMDSGTGGHVSIDVAATVNIVSGGAGGCEINLGNTGNLELKTTSVRRVLITPGGFFMLTAPLATDQAVSASAVGTIIGVLALYDGGSMLIGYVPIYDSFT